MTRRQSYVSPGLASGRRSHVQHEGAAAAPTPTTSHQPSAALRPASATPTNHSAGSSHRGGQGFKSLSSSESRWPSAGDPQSDRWKVQGPPPNPLREGTRLRESVKGRFAIPAGRPFTGPLRRKFRQLSGLGEGWLRATEPRQAAVTSHALPRRSLMRVAVMPVLAGSQMNASRDA